MNLIDCRTGRAVVEGSVLRSIERGELVMVESIGEPVDGQRGQVEVRLVPMGEPFTAYAGYEGEEPNGFMLDGYWLA